MARLSSSQKVLLSNNYVDIARPTSATGELSGAGAVTMGQTAAQVASDIGAAENPLSAIEQPSYHWKFYVTPDISRSGGSTEGNVSQSVILGSVNASQCIITETGVTTFNLFDMELDTITGPNFLSRNAGGQKFTFKISEPYGCTLPDKMYLAAKSVGVRNFMKCPYHLSVDFLGYDPVSGAPVRPIEKSWVWRIMITKLTTKFDETGSIHTFEAIGYNELGNQDQFSLVDVPMNVDIANETGKVGDILKKLQDKINENIAKRSNVKGGGTVPYKIVIKDEPYDASVGASVSSPFEHKIIRNEKFKDSSRNQEKMQISRGTDIAKIIDYLMGKSEDATKMINPANDAEKMDAAAKPQSAIHRVDCEVTNDNFDLKTNEYIRTITFTVRGTVNVRAVGSAKIESDAAANGGADKLQYALSNLLLKKQYDYLFTGTNTEVINLDINFNFMFNVAASMYDGHIFSDMASGGREHDEVHFPRQTENTNFIPRDDGTVVGGMGFNPGTGYAEDLEFSNSLLPMSFMQDGKDPRYNIAPSVESTNLRSGSVYAMILNQLYGTFDGNLQNIELEIRGDPYWLGLTNTESPSSKSSEIVPNFINGEHMFLLKFFIPQGIDDEGQPILRLTDMYSGFYAVMRVVSKFNGGKFTQTLISTRIPVMSVTKLLGGQ